MAGNSVNGSGNGARSGAQTLLLLAAPINVLILKTLASGPQQQTELRRLAGTPAQTTMRAQLRKLAAFGVIERHRRNRFPGALEFELTPSGRSLLLVADTLSGWLAGAPNGPLALGGASAKPVVKALAEAWSTTMLRALAAGPLSLTELDRVIGSLSYPSLERRLAAMRLAGQVEARTGDGRGRPYALTDWLRQGVAPLAAAIHWERRHLARSTAPIAPLDIEAAFLLAVPLLRLPVELSGSCRLAVVLQSSKGPRLAGVAVEVEAGQIVSSSTRLRGHPDAWALGSAGGWLGAVTEGERDGLELGGDTAVAQALLENMRGLFQGIRMALSRYDP